MKKMRRQIFTGLVVQVDVVQSGIQEGFSNEIPNSHFRKGGIKEICHSWKFWEFHKINLSKYYYEYGLVS